MRKKLVNDRMQQGYEYELQESEGENFSSDFNPDLTPKQMLALGIFGGSYFSDSSIEEYPKDWFTGAKLSVQEDSSLNHFGIKASLSREEWQRRGWIRNQDPLGWFQWYCRYYLGRRSEDDARQITRWRQMVRHVAQIKYGCRTKDMNCRPKQRQAILHWAYDSRRL